MCDYSDKEVMAQSRREIPPSLRRKLYELKRQFYL